MLASYAVTSTAALTLEPSERRYSKTMAFAGLAGCLILAFTLPLQSVVAGSAVLAAGAAVLLVRARRPGSA